MSQATRSDASCRDRLASRAATAQAIRFGPNPCSDLTSSTVASPHPIARSKQLLSTPSIAGKALSRFSVAASQAMPARTRRPCAAPCVNPPASMSQHHRSRIGLASRSAQRRAEQCPCPPFVPARTSIQTSRWMNTELAFCRRLSGAKLERSNGGQVRSRAFTGGSAILMVSVGYQCSDR